VIAGPAMRRSRPRASTARGNATSACPPASTGAGRSAPGTR